MSKYSLKRRAIAVVMGVLFVFLQFLQPVYSQTSLNACFQSEAAAQSCARDGLISPTQAASAIRSSIVNPTPTNPFFAGSYPSKEVVTVSGGAAALWYLNNQNMKNLQDSALSGLAPPFTGGQGSKNYNIAIQVNLASGGKLIFNGAGQLFDFMSDSQIRSGQILLGPISSSFSFTQANNTYQISYKGQPFGGAQPLYGNTVSSISVLKVLTSDGSADSSGNPPITDADRAAAAQNLTNPQIYAEAAAAAAAAARDFANKKDVAGAQAAAAAAAGAAGLVNGDPSATQADKDKANGAAAAAAAAAGDAADPTKAPSTPQNPGFAFSRTNFLAYAVSAQGFGNKFPFGMFAPLPASSTQMACPVVNSWGTSVELCFIRDIIRVIKWIVWTNFAIYCFVNL